MKAIKIASALGVVALLSAGSAFAQVSTNLSVTAAVAAKCTIVSLPALSFGAYDPVVLQASTGSDLTAQTDLTIKCTRGSTTVWVGVGDGTYPVAAGGQRRVKAAGSLDYLNYSIYKPDSVGGGVGDACTGTTDWRSAVAADGVAVAAANFATSATEVPVTLCGFMAKNQDAPIDSYSDTVLVTVNF